MKKTDWQEVEGIYGNGKWHIYFHDVSDTTSSGDGAFKTHLLLEFLDYLQIVQYHKCYDAIYEIVVKDKE